MASLLGVPLSPSVASGSSASDSKKFRGPMQSCGVGISNLGQGNCSGSNPVHSKIRVGGCAHTSFSKLNGGCISEYRCGESSFSSSCVGSRGERAGKTRAGGFRLRCLVAQTSSELEVAGEPNIPCENCKGRGWLVCDFCEGQKVNVQSKNRRIYRRCPSCRAAGVVICPRCKVFKCVSFPDDKDGGIAL